MNILILNWRDIRHPFAGGAERITHKYASHWIGLGHRVYWICNSFPGLPDRETLSGVEIIRVGPDFRGSIIRLVFLYPLYLFNSIFTALKLISQHHIGLVVDEIHGLPFFSPLFFKGRLVLLVCEVAGPIWDKMWPFPVNKLGRFMEKLVYRLYSRSDIWAISASTKADILKIIPGHPVKILPLGIDPPPITPLVKSKSPQAVFLARLVRMKGVETAIRSVPKIVKVFPDFRLLIIGRGQPEYESQLRSLTQKLGVASHILFKGRVSEARKYRLLSESHLLIHSSRKEGFGLTVLEAGSVGTPTVALRGSSLDEIVLPGQTGWLFADEPNLSASVISALSDKNLPKISRQSARFASSYFWPQVLDRSAAVTDI